MKSKLILRISGLYYELSLSITGFLIKGPRRNPPIKPIGAPIIKPITSIIGVMQNKTKATINKAKATSQPTIGIAEAIFEASFTTVFMASKSLLIIL